MPLLALAHVGVITALLLQQPEVAAWTSTSALIVNAIADQRLPVELAPPPVETEVTSVVEQPEFDIASDEIAVASGPCNLAATVETALRADKTVGPAVARIPPGARSVSNSLLLWDGAWAQASSIGGNAALGPIRSTVEAQVRAAPEACRTELMIGPRLVVVPDGNDQIVLAFGSGQWRWEKLL